MKNLEKLIVGYEPQYLIHNNGFILYLYNKSDGDIYFRYSDEDNELQISNSIPYYRYLEMNEVERKIFKKYFEFKYSITIDKTL